MGTASPIAYHGAEHVRPLYLALKRTVWCLLTLPLLAGIEPEVPNLMRLVNLLREIAVPCRR